MPKKRVTFSIEEQTDEAIAEYAEQYQGNKSMGLDKLVAEYLYLAARFAALSKRTGPEWPEVKE